MGLFPVCSRKECVFYWTGEWASEPTLCRWCRSKTRRELERIRLMLAPIVVRLRRD